MLAYEAGDLVPPHFVQWVMPPRSGPFSLGFKVFHTLGVEAARIIIAEEIRYIMKAYGIAIDRRHLMLLADVMTFKVRARRNLICRG